jgi:hypothetical protein
MLILVPRIKVWLTQWIVVRSQILGDPAVAEADDIAGREMQQRSLLALPLEIQEVDGTVDIDGNGLAEIGIEVSESGAVDDQIELSTEPCLVFRTESKAWLSDIT